jgi:hypothetical protein
VEKRNSFILGECDCLELVLNNALHSMGHEVKIRRKPKYIGVLRD